MRSDTIKALIFDLEIEDIEPSPTPPSATTSSSSPDWCDGHHLVHWIDGGETSLANTCLLCRRHHRFVHELGWQLTRGDAGAIIAIKPWWMGNDSRHMCGVAPPRAS